MVKVIFTEAIKIGKNNYLEIDTKKFPPKILKRIITKLKDKDTQYIIIKAILDGDYKKNKNTIYLIPPILVTEPYNLITHVLFNESYENLKMIRKLVKTHTPNNKIAIQKLNRIIEKKQMIVPESLPIKKRKII